MDWLLVAQYAVQYGPLIKTAIDEALSNDDLITKVRKVAGPFAPLLEQIGGMWFPNAKPELHIAAVVMTSFDPSVAKWIQGSMNLLVTPSPNLTVDGIYGPKTRAAVTVFETQQGLTPDGWAGRIVQGVIDTLMAKLQPQAASLPAP